MKNLSPYQQQKKKKRKKRKNLTTWRDINQSKQNIFFSYTIQAKQNRCSAIKLFLYTKHSHKSCSKAGTNLATRVNLFLEKEKRMLHYISKKHRLRAAMSQSHILLKRLHLLTLGVRPEKDNPQLGSKIINWNLILNKFLVHVFAIVFSFFANEHFHFNSFVWQMLHLIYCYEYNKVLKLSDTDFPANIFLLKFNNRNTRT